MLILRNAQFSFIRRLAYLVVFTLSAAHSFAAKGPSDIHPQALLVPWTTAGVANAPVELHSTVAKLYPATLKAIKKYENVVKEGQIKTLKLIEVGETKFAAERLEYFANLLFDWGEPGGRDMQYRARDLQARINAVYIELLARSSEQITISMPVLKARADKNRKVLVSIKKLMDAGKNYEADKKFLPVYQELASMGCWFELDPRRAAMGEFDTTYAAVCDAVNRDNRKAADIRLQELAKKVEPDFAPFDATLASLDISSDGKVNWNGEVYSGPEAAMAILVKLEKLHSALLRTVGLYLAMQRDGVKKSELRTLVSHARNSRNTATAAICKLIQADAEHITEEEAARRYNEYLKVLSASPAQSLDATSTQQLESALDQLAARSPAFAGEVANYRAATDDLLRWRRRAAQSVGRRRAESKGTLAIHREKPIRREVSEPLPQIIAKTSAKLIGKMIVAESDFRESLEQDLLVSALMQSIVVRSKMPLPLSLTQTMEAELFAAGASSPLSLAAARAVKSIQRGDLTFFGGTVRDIEFVGLVALLVGKLPERAAAFSILADPELNWADLAGPDHLCCLTTIDPAWACGEFFFVDVAGSHAK